MYIREKLIKIIKIISGILKVAAVLFMAVAVFYIGGLLVSYGLDYETITRAVSFESSVYSIIFAPIILWILKVLGDGIREAYFFNSYFEGDLNGVVSYADLSEITGDSEKLVRRKIRIYRRLFMKNFEIRRMRDEEQIVLNSKKILCQCQNCGAEIKKSDIFVGQCPYCDNLDISVKVLSSDRFYTIRYDNEQNKSSKDYLGKGHKLKVAWYGVSCGVALFIVLVLFCMFIDYLIKMQNKEYLSSVILEGRPGLGSYELVKKSMASQLVYNAVFMVILGAASFLCIDRMVMLSAAKNCAWAFEKAEKPFLTIAKIFKRGRTGKKNREKQLKRVRKAIGFSYLKNCSFEKHRKKIYVTLGRKVVKDKCPNCGAPIKDPVYENYKCQYCGTKIMGVVVKK